MGRPSVKPLCKLPQIHQDVLLGDHVCPPSGVPPRNPRRQFLVVGVGAFSTGAPAPLLLWVGTFHKLGTSSQMRIFMVRMCSFWEAGVDEIIVQPLGWGGSVGRRLLGWHVPIIALWSLALGLAILGYEKLACPVNDWSAVFPSSIRTGSWPGQVEQPSLAFG